MGHTTIGRIGALLAILSLSQPVWVSGCRQSQTPSPPSAQARRPNVILVSIDTCRADRLSCYGFERNTTPNIDAIAVEGVLFRRAIAPTSVTLPSHSSMMTGTTPPFHGVHDNQMYRLADSNVTLAEVLRDNGYETGAVVGSFVLDPKFGLAQGFDFYDANMLRSGASKRTLNDRPAVEINRIARPWLIDHADRPFFLFMHYFDPHFPYEPPQPYSSTFATDRYAGEIAYVDHCIGELRAELIRLGIYDSTLLVITSDHGESLGEHGENSHGWFIYNSTTHVPLVMKLPGRNKSRIVEEKVALIDLAPTILNQLGISVPADMEGQDLSSLLAGDQVNAVERFIYSEALEPSRYGCSSLLALQDSQWKYIQSSQPELYDLRLDPNELNNLYTADSEIASSLRTRLSAFLSNRTRTKLEGGTQASDPETLKRLEGLGYVGGGRNIGYEFETDKEDPKDFLPIYSELMRAWNFAFKFPTGLTHTSTPSGESISLSRSDLAKRICKNILSTNADVSKAHDILGRLAQNEGDLSVAAEHYAQRVRIDPGFVAAHIDLGTVYMKLGNMEQAEAHFRKAIDLLTQEKEDELSIDKALDRLRPVDSSLLKARESLVSLLVTLRRAAEAAELCRTMVRINPNNHKAHTVIAFDLYRNGHNAEAIETLTKALKIKPDYQPALRLLERVQGLSPQQPSP